MITWNHSEGHVDASDLGFAPGTWPLTTVLQNPLGRLRTFKRGAPVRNGECLEYLYTSGKCVLHVIND